MPVSTGMESMLYQCRVLVKITQYGLGRLAKQALNAPRLVFKLNTR